MLACCCEVLGLRGLRGWICVLARCDLLVRLHASSYLPVEAPEPMPPALHKPQPTALSAKTQKSLLYNLIPAPTCVFPKMEFPPLTLNILESLL